MSGDKTGWKIVLGVVSVLSLVSMGGGFLLLPLLIPFHVWAARRSGPTGRMLWSMLPIAAIGMVAWAAVYVTAGESKPWIWLLPVLAALIAGIGMVKLTGDNFRLPRAAHRAS